jgi:hypothetical protein
MADYGAEDFTKKGKGSGTRMTEGNMDDVPCDVMGPRASLKAKMKKKGKRPKGFTTKSAGKALMRG